MMNRFFACAAICVIAALSGCDITGTGRKAGKQVFSTVAATRGSVVRTVAATGTIEPEELVDIGAQVSGKVLYFGRGLSGEELDYCSLVTNGMLLAKIDDVTYVADLNVAEAQLQRSRASEAVAAAQRLQATVNAEQARREWERARKIGIGTALSRTAYENYQAASENADAALGIAEAQLLQSKAAVVEAEASVEKARRNLSYCDIVSSVDGVIIDRRVNVGQTVVSSMSASSLFLVARDLARVQIWVAVNEADIGSIKPGCRATFTVDTFPGRVFEGVVKRIRLNATITSNVVTYTVEIDTDNSDHTLLPYLTANVEFQVERVDNAIVVPAKALRFRPQPNDGDVQSGPAVYVLEDGAPRRVPVRVLLSNGMETAVEPVGEARLSEGDIAITGTTILSQGGATAVSADKASPFLPNMPRPPKRSNNAPR